MPSALDRRSIGRHIAPAHNAYMPPWADAWLCGVKGAAKVNGNCTGRCDRSHANRAKRTGRLSRWDVIKQDRLTDGGRSAPSVMREILDCKEGRAADGADDGLGVERDHDGCLSGRRYLPPLSRRGLFPGFPLTVAMPLYATYCINAHVPES